MSCEKDRAEGNCEKETVPKTWDLLVLNETSRAVHPEPQCALVAAKRGSYSGAPTSEPVHQSRTSETLGTLWDHMIAINGVTEADWVLD